MTFFNDVLHKIIISNMKDLENKCAVPAPVRGSQLSSWSEEFLFACGAPVWLQVLAVPSDGSAGQVPSDGSAGQLARG